jgi:hypothetical protein
MSANSNRISTPRRRALTLARLGLLALVTLVAYVGCNAKEEDFFTKILGEITQQGAIRTSVTIDGSPAPGIAVTIQRDGTTVDTGTTGQDGTFLSDFLEPGSHVVLISGQPQGATCQPGTQQTVNVTVGQTAPANFACTTPPTTGTITGRVVVADQPRQGAGVSAGGRSATSGADGSFTITEVPTGQQMVSTTLTGHVCEVKTANVTAGQTSNVGDIDCAPQPTTGTITGRVVVGGQPRQGAVVTAGGRSATSGADGTFTITEVPTGSQTVSTTLTNHTCESKTANVTAGQTSNVGDINCAPQPTGFAVGFTDLSWIHDQPMVSSTECKTITTTPAQPDATFSCTTTGPDTPPSGVITTQPVTGTLDENGRANLRVRINRFGRYVNMCTVTAGGVQQSATAEVIVPPDAGTCQLAPSSQRFKRDVVGLLPDGVTLLGLRPVAFRYLAAYGDPAVPQIGLIAEEVVRVYPEAVALDAAGRPEGIYYGVLTGRVIETLESRTAQALETGVARLAEALE